MGGVTKNEESDPNEYPNSSSHQDKVCKEGTALHYPPLGQIASRAANNS